MNETQIQTISEFDNHKEFVTLLDPYSDLQGYIAIHRQHSGFPSLGATRFWHYSNEEEAARDVLRLSRLMSYKSALADLPYGGAKAVIIVPKNKAPNRVKLFKAYGHWVEKLAGRFITGTDMGVNNEDLRYIKESTSHVIGQGVNSAYYTALGVINSIEVVAERLFSDHLNKKFKVIIQGIGKTGRCLLELLSQRKPETEIVVTDISDKALRDIKKDFLNLSIVNEKNIYDESADFFCPCATGGVLNKENIKRLRVKAVVGSANNQLENSQAGTKLWQRGIIYAPDYLVNAGGIISVVDQYENSTHNHDRIVSRIDRIPAILKVILEKSSINNCPPEAIADDLARSILLQRSNSVSVV